jgi:hypothetical protein
MHVKKALAMLDNVKIPLIRVSRSFFHVVPFRPLIDVKREFIAQGIRTGLIWAHPHDAAVLGAQS